MMPKMNLTTCLAFMQMYTRRTESLLLGCCNYNLKTVRLHTADLKSF
jgi:hypothetical protein